MHVCRVFFEACVSVFEVFVNWSEECFSAFKACVSVYESFVSVSEVCSECM